MVKYDQNLSSSKRNKHPCNFAATRSDLALSHFLLIKKATFQQMLFFSLSVYQIVQKLGSDQKSCLPFFQFSTVCKNIKKRWRNRKKGKLHHFYTFDTSWKFMTSSFKEETSLVLVLWMRFYFCQKGPKWSNPRFGHLTLPHVFFRLGQVSNCSWSLFFQHHQPLIASCFGDGTSQTLTKFLFQSTKKQLFFHVNPYQSEKHQQVLFFFCTPLMGSKQNNNLLFVF